MNPIRTKTLLLWPVLALALAMGSCRVAAAAPEAQAGRPPDGPAPLPGSGLAQHDFLYAGEWDHRKPDQTLFLVRDGRIVWTYSIPTKTPDGVLQEWGDATLRSDGTILFARKTGAGLVGPGRTLLWNYDAPKGTEVHVAQPLGRDRAFLVQNGDPAQLMIVNLRTGVFERTIPLPTGNPAVPHGQFRCVRRTTAGTYLVAHMDWNRVAEYDEDGRERWALAVLSPWAAVRLPNGNTLVSSNRGFVREFSPRGEVVWEYTREDAAAAGIRLFNCQGLQRLRNGNTVIANWCPNGLKDPANWPDSVQVVEVSPARQVVWALRSWSEPADLGPATNLQILDEPGSPEAGELLR